MTFLLLRITSGQSQVLRDSLSINPNPFCNATTIHFDLVNNDTVSLVVYNIYGEVEKQIYSNKLLSAGTYSLNYSGDSLVDGVYILILQNGIHKKKVLKISKQCSALIQNPITENRNMILYPNPTEDIVIISIQGLKTIVITNIHGQYIKTIKTESQTISLADLLGGTYLLSIFNKDNKFLTSRKVVYEK